MTTTRSPRLEEAYKNVIADVDQLRKVDWLRIGADVNGMAGMLLLDSLDRLIDVAKADGAAEELARVTAMRAEADDELAKETT